MTSETLLDSHCNSNATNAKKQMPDPITVKIDDNASAAIARIAARVRRSRPLFADLGGALEREVQDNFQQL